MPEDLAVVATIGGDAVTIPAMAIGQNASVTFEGVAGQRVALLASGSTYSGSNLRVGGTAPDGADLAPVRTTESWVLAVRTFRAGGAPRRVWVE